MVNFKERIIGSLSTAILIGSSLGSACDNPKPMNPTETPAITKTTQPAESVWNGLTPMERLRRLEIRDFPKTKDFDLDKELSLATAQFYCQVTKCNKSSEQMAASVSYLTDDEIVKKTVIETNVALSEEDLNKQKKKQLAFTTRDKKAIYVNSTLLKEVIRKIYTSPQELQEEELGDKDLTTVVKMSILVHEFTHMNSQPQTKDFFAFSASLPDIEGPINFGQIYGFEILGNTQDGKIFYIEGGNEAVTERAAQLIGSKSGLYVGVADEYSNGADLVDQLNKGTDVTNEEFLKYVSGQLPSEKLIEKWGKGDFKTGVLLLASIGLYVQGYTTVNDTQEYIEDVLETP